ncbi:tetratricopeptide repeat protein [Candidatus Sumerlaeota bacterium]|nr:tetratricopeptide repeat protein [Candidatus Sumerlaeota bacterium]
MSEWSETRFRIIGALVVTLVAFVAFAPALHVGFVYDDYVVVAENSALPNLLKAKNYFSHDYFDCSGEASYRPLVTASYALDCLAWGKKPLGYHLTNQIWHTVACVALLLLCVSLRASRETSLLVALVYATHPIHSESVIGVGFREDLLCAAFYFSALALWPAGAARSQTPNAPAANQSPRLGDAVHWARLCGALLLYAMALLSKEMALSFPLAALAKELRLRRLTASSSRQKARWKPVAIRQVAAWTATCAAIGMYTSFSSVSPTDLHVDEAGLFVRVCAFPWISIRYLGLLLRPYPLSIEHIVDTGGPLFAWTAIASALVVCLLSTLAWRLRRAFPAGIESLVLFYILLAPVSNLVAIANPMSERYLAIPAAAFSWFAAHLLGLVRPRLRWFAASLLIVAYGMLSWVRIEDWREPGRLWLRAIELGNETVRTDANLGSDLYTSGTGLDEAIGWLRQAVELNPQCSHRVRYNLAMALMEKGRYPEAAENYRAILRDYPDSRKNDVFPAKVHSSLGLALYRIGEVEPALHHLDEAIRIAPGLREPYNNRGAFLANMGRPAEAVDQFAKAVQIDPGWGVARCNLALALRATGRLDEAIEQYRTALELQPGLLSARLDLARLLIATNRKDEAMTEYRRLLGIAPNHVQAARELRALLGRPDGQEK